MKPTIAARVTNLIIFAVSLIALLALLGHVQRRDAADQQAARQASQSQTEQQYASLNRDAERMTSYERIGK